MRASVNFVLTFAAVLFGFLLVPRAASASTADCPVEPRTGVPIGDGEVFAGTNCNLYTVGDIDGFVFSGTSGDTYQLAAAVSGGSNDICLTLYSPTAVQIYSGCTAVHQGVGSVVTDQKLTTTGTYTIDITETGSSNTQNYAVSLERLYPFPPNAQPIPNLDQEVAGDIAELTDSNAFTFTEATTGTYQVSATVISGGSYDICMTVYEPSGASAGSGCTSIHQGVGSVVIAFTPPQNGTSMPFVSAAGNDGTATYNLEVSCKVGTCPPQMPPPSCTLTDALTYNTSTSTLTMNFTVGNSYAATWNAWLTYQNTLVPIPGFPISQPITNPPVPIPKTYTGLPAEGKVGVLSTLTTGPKGITCSSWQQINTGTGP